MRQGKKALFKKKKLTPGDRIIFRPPVSNHMSIYAEKEEEQEDKAEKGEGRRGWKRREEVSKGKKNNISQRIIKMRYDVIEKM